MVQPKILIASDIITNAYIPSLMEAYKNAGCTVVMGASNFYHASFIPDILHLQWPESLYLYTDFSIYGWPVSSVIKERFDFYKSKGTIFVWTIHNLKPHESNDLGEDAEIYNLFTQYADLVVHHGQFSVDEMLRRYTNLAAKANIICPHGDYGIQYKTIDKIEARRELNLPHDRNILLNFGYIKGYKGYDQLKYIFKGWNASRKFLLVAGEFQIGNNIKSRIYRFWNGKIRSRTSNHAYCFSMVPNHQVALYFSAADYVVLTHKSGLTSGIIAMAITFKKPIVYPNIGNFKEQVAGWEASECYDVGDIESAICALQRLTVKTQNDLNNNNSFWLEQNSWHKHVEKILDGVKTLKIKIYNE